MEIRDLYDQINVAETYEEQNKLWTEIITTYKDYPLVVSKAYVNRGNMKFVNGKTDAAFADYKKAEEITPDQPIGLLGKGAALLKMERPEEAVVELEKALELTQDILPD